MSNIIPLPISRGSLASSNVTEGEGAYGNEERDDKLEKKAEQSVMDEFVDFLLKKGDKGMIENFQHCLSDFSRHKEHKFDSQLERIDKWQSRENHRCNNLYDAILEILSEPNINILGDYYNIQNNKIEN